MCFCIHASLIILIFIILKMDILYCNRAWWNCASIVTPSLWYGAPHRPTVWITGCVEDWLVNFRFPFCFLQMAQPVVYVLESCIFQWKQRCNGITYTHSQSENRVLLFVIICFYAEVRKWMYEEILFSVPNFRVRNFGMDFEVSYWWVCHRNWPCVCLKLRSNLHTFTETVSGTESA
jgi:hypothetical protein